MLKFLIIEDDQAQRMLLKSILKKNFTCEIKETDNGQGGLEMLKTEIPTLIFLDLTMPVMDGHQVLTKLFENPLYKKIPIIVTTAISDREIVGSLISMGICDYLLKPIEINSTITRINKVISRITENQSSGSPGQTKLDKPKLLLLEPDKYQKELINSLIGDKFFIQDVKNGMEALSAFEKHRHRYVLVSDKVGLLDKKIVTQKIREIAENRQLFILLIFNDEKSNSAKVFSFDGLIKRSLDPVQFRTELLNIIPQELPDAGQ